MCSVVAYYAIIVMTCQLSVTFHFLTHVLLFVVVKFLQTEEDDNIYYEVALAKWLVQVDENMIGTILWPDSDALAGKLVRTEASADETWQQLEVEVKRYYETYIDARNAAKGFETYASAYESDSVGQMGRGKRRRRLKNPLSSSGDSSDSDTKKRKQDKSRSKIPVAPFPPPLPASSSSQKKSLNIVSKKNITPLTVVSNKKQSKTATPSSSTTGIKQHKFLDKIINLRQQAANKAQQRKEAMCLRNISHKLPVGKKAVDSTSSELPAKASGTCRSESQSSSIVSSLKSHSVEKSSPSNEMSRDIQPLLSQSDKTDTTRSSTNDCIRQTPPRDDEFNEDRSEIDNESDKVSLASSQTVLTSQLNTGLEASVAELKLKVDNMRAKLDLVLINQCKLNRFVLPEEKIFCKPPNIPALPLETIEQVKRFEKFLSIDVQLADTCYYLKSLPLGNDEARAVSKLMSNLMSNSLAQQYNFDGHGTKLAFKSTKLWELVQGTLLLKFEESDLSEALKSLRSWLRNAKGRMKPAH
ncbi:uncharacterized protein [Temnothorax nylanderi]|uniref:uncharacterized protein isoform X2 n=1 Tax=Temnothorax nylanderi TaxID=102681 RepID=UPI003A88348F